MPPTANPRRKLLESDLSGPVSRWLTSLGFTPYAEVSIPHYSPSRIDLIGRKDTQLIAIELKQTLSKQVIHQAYISDLLTKTRYAAVATSPRASGIALCVQRGIGLLSITNDTVTVILEPNDRRHEILTIRNSYQVELHKILDNMSPFGLAGKPCTKGEGPAQTCYDHVAAYQILNPKAKWLQIFNHVPNHYSSPKSMASAMKIVQATREDRTPKLKQSNQPYLDLQL